MIQGVYVEPLAVLQDTAYASQLQIDSGINAFQLRTGFRPGGDLKNVSDAVKALRDLGGNVWFLVGTWWGEGIGVHDDSLRSIMPSARYRWTREGKYAMRMPGGTADEEISEALQTLIQEFRPDAICLTHARFKHAADIPGLFEWGFGRFTDRMNRAGLSAADLLSAWEKAIAGLRKISMDTLQELCLECDIPQLLNRLSDSDLFTRWFAERCRVIESSVAEFYQLAKMCSTDRIRFGVNAVNPGTAYLSGQDYAALAQRLDFIQPLLGYVRWHVLQPIRAWALHFLGNRSDLDEQRAIDLATGVLDFPSEVMPKSVDLLDKIGEGDEQLIDAVVAAQIALAARHSSHGCDVFPVLRGRDWPAGLFGRLRSQCLNAPLSGAFYQGTEHLSGTSKVVGWQ